MKSPSFTVTQLNQLNPLAQWLTTLDKNSTVKIYLPNSAVFQDTFQIDASLSERDIEIYFKEKLQKLFHSSHANYYWDFQTLQDNKRHFFVIEAEPIQKIQRLVRINGHTLKSISPLDHSTINLLPWRKLAAKKRYLKYSYLIFFYFLSLIFVLYAIKTWVNFLNHQTQRDIGAIQKSIALVPLDRFRQNERTLAHLEALKRAHEMTYLKTQNKLALLTIIANALPPHCVLDHLQYSDKVLALTGDSITTDDISLYRKNLDNKLRNAKISPAVISHQNDHYHFELKLYEE